MLCQMLTTKREVDKCKVGRLVREAAQILALTPPGALQLRFMIAKRNANVEFLKEKNAKIERKVVVG